MPTIPMRQAEMLSYLQGCGPVGEWVEPFTKHIATDLGIARTQVCQLVKQLVGNGFIEVKRIGLKRKAYRVLIRLERPDVGIIDHGSRSDISKQKMREKALAREARRRAKFRKIRYAGYVPNATAQW